MDPKNFLTKKIHNIISFNQFTNAVLLAMAANVMTNNCHWLTYKQQQKYIQQFFSYTSRIL
jgi:hypothetical protein